MNNTKINYLYRDGANYKVHNDAVLTGTLSQDQIQDIIGTLDEGEFFLPAQIGLPEERPEDWDEQIDHPWFELNEDGFEPTDETPTVSITAKEVYDKFMELAGKWNDYIDMDGKEIMPS